MKADNINRFSNCWRVVRNNSSRKMKSYARSHNNLVKKIEKSYEKLSKSKNTKDLISNLSQLSRRVHRIQGRLSYSRFTYAIRESLKAATKELTEDVEEEILTTLRQLKGDQQMDAFLKFEFNDQYRILEDPALANALIECSTHYEKKIPYNTKRSLNMAKRENLKRAPREAALRGEWDHYAHAITSGNRFWAKDKDSWGLANFFLDKVPLQAKQTLGGGKSFETIPVLVKAIENAIHQPNHPWKVGLSENTATPLENFINEELLPLLKGAAYSEYLTHQIGTQYQKNFDEAGIEEIAQTINNLPIGKKHLLYYGFSRHAMGLLVHRTSKDQATLTVYNTGAGIGLFHPKLEGSNKYQTFLTIKDVPFAQLQDANLWKKFVYESYNAPYSPPAYHFLTEELGKGGTKVPPSESKEDYEAEQKSGSCAYQWMLAFLREQMLHLDIGTKAERLALYKYLKATVLHPYATELLPRVDQVLQAAAQTKISKMGADLGLFEICRDDSKYEKAKEAIAAALEKCIAPNERGLDKLAETVRAFKSPRQIARYQMLRTALIELERQWQSYPEMVEWFSDEDQEYLKLALARFKHHKEIENKERAHLMAVINERQPQNVATYLTMRLSVPLQREILNHYKRGGLQNVSNPLRIPLLKYAISTQDTDAIDTLVEVMGNDRFALSSEFSFTPSIFSHFLKIGEEAVQKIDQGILPEGFKELSQETKWAFLMRAIKQNNTSSVKCLLGAGVNPNFTPQSARYSLYTIAAPAIGSNLEILKMLLSEGAKLPNFEEVANRSFQMATSKEKKILIAYLEKGFDPFKIDLRGVSFFTKAIREIISQETLDTLVSHAKKQGILDSQELFQKFLHDNFVKAGFRHDNRSQRNHFIDAIAEMINQSSCPDLLLRTIHNQIPGALSRILRNKKFLSGYLEKGFDPFKSFVIGASLFTKAVTGGANQDILDIFVGHAKKQGILDSEDQFRKFVNTLTSLKGDPRIIDAIAEMIKESSCPDKLLPLFLEIVPDALPRLFVKLKERKDLVPYLYTPLMAKRLSFSLPPNAVKTVLSKKRNKKLLKKIKKIDRQTSQITIRRDSKIRRFFGTLARKLFGVPYHSIKLQAFDTSGKRLFTIKIAQKDFEAINAFNQKKT